ncbi:hypothetical protein BDR22DRAFT_873751 [Usnea florida]
MTIMEGVQDSFLDFTTYNFKTAFTQSFTDGNFTYNPEDVIQSSISGWWSYGYNYTLINQDYGFSPGALDSVENFRDQLFAVANIKSNSEGVYNLPVCVLNELASIPECFKAFSDNGDKTPLTDDELDNCFIHPINCLGDQSGVLPTKNATYGFQRFRDYITDRLKDNLDSEDTYSAPAFGTKRSVKPWETIDVGSTV